MGFDDFLKDLFDSIDWGDVLGSVLQWIIDHPNIYSAGIGMIISLIQIADKVRGMSEEEAKAEFKAGVKRLEAIPDLPVDFEY